MTTALHSVVLTGATDGQLIVQPEVSLTTVVEAEAELSAGCASLVVLDTLAVSVMTVPFAVPESTLKTSVNTAVELAGKVAMVQSIVPVLLPTDGVVQEKAGSWVSDTKVVLAGTELVSATVSAPSGPLLVSSTL